MSKKLTKIVNEPNLSWDKSLTNSKNKFLVSLSSSTINQIIKNRSTLEKNDPNQFKLLKDEILTFKKILITGPGFFIIDGKNLNIFSNKEMEQLFSIISQALGDLYIQNIKNEKLVIITDEGKSMKTGGRYHQTKEGGSFHTDSPQWSKVPDFIGLLCIRPAKVGGISKFVSAYTIHNQFSKTNPNFLNFVYDNFHFDKRGEFKENESPTTFEPIFKYHDKQLMFRYLRNYIDAGQKIAEKPLTNEQNNILDELDKIIHNEKFSVSYDLKKFDMTFFNNHRIIHGRTSFEDFSDTEKKRFMIRSWIKDNS